MVNSEESNETDIVSMNESNSSSNEELVALQGKWISQDSDEVIIFEWNQKNDFFWDELLATGTIRLENNEMIVMNEWGDDSYGRTMNEANELVLTHLWCGAQTTYSKEE